MARKLMTQEDYDNRVCRICGDIPHPTGKRKSDGVQIRKNGLCTKHHQEELAIKHGLQTYSALTGPCSGYLKYRKTYCENEDNHLGFSCSTEIHWVGVLDVHHRDGYSNNNDPKNLITLCKCCHAYYHHRSPELNKTPGRKTLKLMEKAA